MSQQIKTALSKIFEQHRLVFWYSEDAEVRALFEEVELAGVEKLEIDNNEFAVKCQVLEMAPKQQFLLFSNQAQPRDIDNWLLDLCLANHVFSTDRSAMFLQDLKLGIEFKPLVEQHLAFFGNKDRVGALQRLVQPKEEDFRSLRYKLLAVICKNDSLELESVLFSLIAENAEEKTGIIGQIEKYNLTDFFWKEVEQQYGYVEEQPSVDDFILAMFETESSRFTNLSARLNRASEVLVKRWQDSAKNQGYFEQLAKAMEQTLRIEEKIEAASLEKLLSEDVFRVIDLKVLVLLRQHILEETQSAQAIHNLLDQRSNRFWYAEFANLYEALRHGLNFLDTLKRLRLEMVSLADGIQKYVSNFYKIDLYYRQFIFAMQRSNNASFLQNLGKEIERKYTNQFLLPLNDEWQLRLEEERLGQQVQYLRQRQFWQRLVLPYLETDNRIFVVISDGLRYESGAELCERLLTVDRFEASIQPMVATVPSFTQLGMAALLPHRELELEQSGNVRADGKSTVGLAGRNKVLQEASSGKAVAISAEEFVKMSREEGRDYTKPYNVIYIYHNVIDHAGESEEDKLFARTEDEFGYLITLLKKIANFNGTNVLITADHGYLYQHEVVAESDFANFAVEGDIVKYNRRFVIGENLHAPKGAMHFSAKDLDLAGNLEIAIPKSVNRLRQRGAGSRYVHGGMSLQELVVPVISLNKRRTKEDDTQPVSVDLIQTTSQITANQLTLTFYQQQAVGGKLLPRKLRLGFYDKQGKLLSNQEYVNFNSDSKEARVRETKLQFIFSQLEEYTGKEVMLRLEEGYRNTNSFTEYKKFSFRVLLSFTSDFDDFDL